MELFPQNYFSYAEILSQVRCYCNKKDCINKIIIRINTSTADNSANANT